MRPSQCQGFTLIECILSLLMIGLLSAGFCSLLFAAFATSELPSMTLNGITYAKAPDIGQMNAAIDTQMLFQKLQQKADAILVFGGKGSHPYLDDSTQPSPVINWDSWDPASLGRGLAGPTDANFDPARQFSSWDQRGALSAFFTTGVSTADFSVVFVQGFNRIIGMAKQRQLSPAGKFNGSQVHCYDVEVRSFDSAGAMSAKADYHVCYPIGEDSWRIAPGASHVWFRYDPSWDRDEEAGAFLVFADPYVVAGENPAAEVLPISEFSFYVPVVN
ncbi:MAG TPA: prepilin-type N-terminal cleavage/methylation domain-containing protein [Opitutaceae bacterium]|jgi:prepilin-type N-terminal cleavage/methylation domain-containing protein|nr:prepilin-type N-terminal cleavage/methylation domain-containing protein [Opitutaceae bacterium]